MSPQEEINESEWRNPANWRAGLFLNPEYIRLQCDLELGDFKKRGALASCRDEAYQGLQTPNH